VDEVDKVHALDDPARSDAEAGDDAARELGVVQGLGKRGVHTASSSARRCASAKSSVPSYRLRPRMAPSTPSLSTAHRALMSFRLVTPPEAMMGVFTCWASLTVASMFTPESVPSRPMSV